MCPTHDGHGSSINHMGQCRTSESRRDNFSSHQMLNCAVSPNWHPLAWNTVFPSSPLLMSATLLSLASYLPSSSDFWKPLVGQSHRRVGAKNVETSRWPKLLRRILFRINHRNWWLGFGPPMPPSSFLRCQWPLLLFNLVGAKLWKKVMCNCNFRFDLLGSKYSSSKY